MLKPLKLFKENIRVKFQDFRLGKELLDIKPKARDLNIHACKVKIIYNI